MFCTVFKSEMAYLCKGHFPLEEKIKMQHEMSSYVMAATGVSTAICSLYVSHAKQPACCLKTYLRSTQLWWNPSSFICHFYWHLISLIAFCETKYIVQEIAVMNDVLVL